MIINKKINLKFLTFALLTSSSVYSIDMIADISDRAYVKVENRYTIPRMEYERVEKILSFEYKMPKDAIENASYFAKTYMKNIINSGIQNSKRMTGYGMRSISSLLKGSAYMANISAVTSLYGGKVLDTVGKIDGIGKIIFVNGYKFTTFGLTFLNENHNSDKINAYRETVGVAAVVSGGLTQGFGGLACLMGMTGKILGNVSGHYISPSFSALANSCIFAGNKCDDISKSIFSSL